MRVEVRNNNVDKALKILKKRLTEDGLFNDLREREFHMTKGEKKRRERASAKRRIKRNLENPSTTSTPLKHDHPLSWWVKWAASLILIVAMIMTTNNLYPYNMFLQFFGVSGWLWVAIMWNDRSLIVVNSVACAIFLNGIFQYFLKA